MLGPEMFECKKLGVPKFAGSKELGDFKPGQLEGGSWVVEEFVNLKR